MDVSGHGTRFDRVDIDVVGYSVEALDGSIGKIDEATFDAGTAYIVVDTGPGSRQEGHASRRDYSKR